MHVQVLHRNHVFDLSSKGFKEVNSCGRQYTKPVCKQIHQVSFRLERPNHFCSNPTFHVSLFKSFIPSPLNEEEAPAIPPASLVVEGLPACTVKGILRSRRQRVSGGQGGLQARGTELSH